MRAGHGPSIYDPAVAFAPTAPRFGRRAFLRAASAVAAPGAFGTPPSSVVTLDLPQLRYEGNWNPRPGAVVELAREVRLRTRLEPVARPSVVTLDGNDVFRSPFLYVAGDGPLPPLDAARLGRLRTFAALGGILVFDEADGGTDRAFRDAVADLVARIFPGRSLAPLSSEHVLFRSFYILRGMVGRTAADRTVHAVLDGGRIQAMLLRNDLGGALARDENGLARHPCIPGGPAQREQATRFGVNLVLYATCLDYKADRAHVETLLRARRWR